MVNTKVKAVYTTVEARCLKCGRKEWLYPWVLSEELGEMELYCRDCYIEELNHPRNKDRLKHLVVVMPKVEESRANDVAMGGTDTTYLSDNVSYIKL